MQFPYLIFLLLAISVGINILFFIIAFLFKSDVFTDITYTLTFIILGLTGYFLSNYQQLSRILILVIILVWAIRLGLYLFIRILKIKVDHRFDDKRNSFIKFGGFWLIQSVTVWIVSLPFYLALSYSEINFNWWIWILFSLAIFFILFETIADLQKWFFINKRKDKNKFINVGLWKISRHPNYFAEIMIWWIVFLIIIMSSHSNTFIWIGIIGPLYITALIYKVSGVPLLEKSAFKKYQNNPEYIKYLKQTPCVIPLIGKRGILKYLNTNNKK